MPNTRSLRHLECHLKITSSSQMLRQHLPFPVFEPSQCTLIELEIFYKIPMEWSWSQCACACVHACVCVPLVVRLVADCVQLIDFLAIARETLIHMLQIKMWAQVFHCNHFVANACVRASVWCVCLAFAHLTCSFVAHRIFTYFNSVFFFRLPFFICLPPSFVRVSFSSISVIW